MLKIARGWMGPVLLLLTAVAGMGLLFHWRLHKGDGYPAYSTWRSDPIGSRALFEALETLPGNHVQRFHGGLETLPDGKGTVLFRVGGDWVSLARMEGTEFEELDRFVREGGRLVISLRPYRQSGGLGGSLNATNSIRPGLPAGMAPVSAAEEWGFNLKWNDLPKQEEGEAPVRVEARRSPGSDPRLPLRLPWHSGAVWEPKKEAGWQAVYQRGDLGVLMQRDLGLGRLVVATDSFLWSNEAMREHRRTPLLVWLISDRKRIYFDEAHLGVSAKPGVVALIRRFHLQGLFVGLVVLAGLHIWRNRVAFIPSLEAVETVGSTGGVVGRDSMSGFVNLLRRHLGPKDLLAACVEEFLSSLGGDRRKHKAFQEEARKLANEVRKRGGSDLLDTYGTLSQRASEARLRPAGTTLAGNRATQEKRKIK